MKIVIATSNRGKLNEIKAILEGVDMDIVGLDGFPKLEMPEETEETFAGNAVLKAAYVARKTGLLSLADDSGLVVDILDGRPGVHSARYAGDGATDEENYLKLLGELEGTDDEARGARFVCVIALARPDGSNVAFAGELKGRIARTPSGGNGFGYDPVFYLPEMKRAVAELGPKEKNAISHRAAALKKFRAWLENNMEWCAMQ